MATNVMPLGGLAIPRYNPFLILARIAKGLPAMPTTKKKPVARPLTESPVATNGPAGEVFTLAEAAAYLRVAEADVLHLAKVQELPGRRIGNEWRFLKAGLQDWLRTPARISGKEAFLALAGSWKDDPDIEEIVREAHRRRGRPVSENEE
jgi:excisionase family DNA binding protein